MHQLGLNPEQFRSILRACQRVLMNPSVLPLDLKQFLAVHLSSSYPELAARIVQFDDREMRDLRTEILDALAGSPEIAPLK